MNPVVRFDHVGLASQGSTFSLDLLGGQCMALMGPPESGKSSLLRSIHEKDTPAQGAISITGGCAISEPLDISKRMTPLKVARAATGSTTSTVGEALYACGLHDHADTPLTELSHARIAACQLLRCFSSTAKLLLFDSSFDSIDLWTLDRAWPLLQRRLSVGTSAIIATHRADVAARCDYLLLLERGQARFLGTPQEFLASKGPGTIEVQTRAQAGVRALVAPMRIRIEDTDAGILMSAPNGQELAARLLTEGYGDVELVVVRNPTLAEVVRTTVR